MTIIILKIYASARFSSLFLSAWFGVKIWPDFMILSNSLFRKNDHSIKAEALGRIVLCVSLHVKVFPSWPQRVTVCWRHWRVFVKDIPGIHAEIPSCMNVCTICSLNCRKGVFLSYLSVCVWLNMTVWPVFHQIVCFCRSVSSVDVLQYDVIELFLWFLVLRGSLYWVTAIQRWNKPKYFPQDKHLK